MLDQEGEQIQSLHLNSVTSVLCSAGPHTVQGTNPSEDTSDGRILAETGMQRPKTNTTSCTS